MFIAIVGPSGVGKDSLIAHARQVLGSEGAFRFPRRIITRPPEPTEPHASVTPEEFRQALAQGLLALDWQAHGLSYGIPATVDDDLAAGCHVIANLSRAIIPIMRQRFGRSGTILVSADAAIIAARLSARGREDASDQASRLARSAPSSRDFAPDIVVENNGSLAEAGTAFIRAIHELVAEEAPATS